MHIANFWFGGIQTPQNLTTIWSTVKKTTKEKEKQDKEEKKEKGSSQEKPDKSEKESSSQSTPSSTPEQEKKAKAMHDRRKKKDFSISLNPQPYQSSSPSVPMQAVPTSQSSHGIPLQMVFGLPQTQISPPKLMQQQQTSPSQMRVPISAVYQQQQFQQFPQQYPQQVPVQYSMPPYASYNPVSSFSNPNYRPISNVQNNILSAFPRQFNGNEGPPKQ